MRWRWRPACQSGKLQWRNAPPPFSSLSILKNLCFWYRGLDGFRTHGAGDVVDDYGEDYVAAARALLSDWVDREDEMHSNSLKPYQNAENIAAAATG